jgi:hypothetical protein
MQLCKHRMHVGTGALAGQSPSRKGPLLHARSTRGGEVVEMVECGCRWPANVASNHRAVANPTPSLVLPVAIQLDSTAQAILATTLRIPCALSWAGLAQFVDGERRRPTARVVADWARGLGGAAGKSRLGEHHHAGCGGDGEEGGRGVEGGGGGGGGALGSKPSCSGPTSKIAIVSSPLAVAAFLCASLPSPQCVRVPRVHRLQHCSSEYGTIASYIEVFNQRSASAC